MKNCQEITEEIEKKAFEKLSFWECFELWFHKMVCPNCKKYAADSEKLDRILKQSIQSKNHQFTPEEKEAMVQKMNHH